MSTPTACAYCVGCQCARCKRPLTVEGHPITRPPEISDVPRFQSARKVKPSCWREDINSEWAIVNALRTIADSRRR